jgi:DNA processing protein
MRTPDIAAPAMSRGEREAEWSAVRALARSEPEYPVQLAAVPSTPEMVYVRGEIRREDALAIAIVGARRATQYGLEVAWRLAADLAARGITVVSGLARGIDRAAHEGALDAGGRTIAVLGSGVDVIYPPENRGLARRIAERGAVLSQFAPGTPPRPHHFPERNRVIAGLSLGVVVVEAAERSGALITAGLAAELGREVMAVPGRVTSPESQGSHRLIRDGAVLVGGWEDVVAQLPARWRACVRTAPEVSGAAPLDLEPEGGDAGRVLAALGDEPASIDELIERSGISSGRAAALLVELELAGHVRQLDGKRFAVARRV